MSLRHRSAIARGRVLRLLAESLSQPDLLCHEPGLAEFRVQIGDLAASINNGEPIGQSLEPWLGYLAVFADLAANHGCLKEWLQTTAAFLESRTRQKYYLPVCLETFLQAGIPLVESLPLFARQFEETDPENVTEALKSGSTLADVVADWNIYRRPLLEWLAYAEGRGELLSFHSNLSPLFLDNAFIWPLHPGLTRPVLSRSVLLLVRFGLMIGKSLPEIMTAIPERKQVVPWWSEVRSAYLGTGEFARALGRGGMVTPLAIKILERAEYAGQLPDAILQVVRGIDDGLFYPADFGQAATKNRVRAEDTLSKAAHAEIDPDALEQWIEGISIRGRMAYALLCIESLCRAWNVDSAEVGTVLAKFWEFTSSGRLDVWDVESQRVQPYLYAFYDDFVEEKEWYEMAPEFEFDGLSDDRQETLGRLLVLLHGFSGNLYGGFQSHVTAKPMVETINVMIAAGLELPDRNRVSLSRVEESGGWGNSRPRHFFL